MLFLFLSLKIKIEKLRHNGVFIYLSSNQTIFSNIQIKYQASKKTVNSFKVLFHGNNCLICN